MVIGTAVMIRIKDCNPDLENSLRHWLVGLLAEDLSSSEEVVAPAEGTTLIHPTSRNSTLNLNGI